MPHVWQSELPFDQTVQEGFCLGRVLLADVVIVGCGDIGCNGIYLTSLKFFFAFCLLSD